MAPRDPLSALTCAAYAAPALPLAALYFPVFVYLAPFYAGAHGVALGALGALFIAVRLLDAVTDPLVGWLSDKTPARFGRRRVWLIAATPVVALAAWMVFVPGAEAGFSHVALWLTLLTLGWSLAQTPYYAWGAEISGDYEGRAKVTGWREGAGLLGAVGAIAAFNLADNDAEGMRAVALIVVIGGPLAVAAALIFTTEPRDHSRAALPPRAAIKAIAGNPLFRRLLSAYFVNGLANALPAGLFLFYTRDLLADPDAGALILVYFLCAVIGLPFWTWAAKRLSKHRAWGWAMIYASLCFAPAAFLGPGDTIWFAVICVVTGLALGADMSLPAAIQADVVDDDTAATGEQRTGVFFAVWSLATKAALALGGGLALIALDLAGFEAGGENGAFALGALGALYALAPAVLKLIAVAMMWNFPLDRARQSELRAKIESA